MLKRNFGIMIGVSVAGFFAIVTFLIVAGIYLFFDKDFQKQADQAESDGHAFGQTTDQIGCMTEGLTRAYKMTMFDVNKLTANGMFVGGCLDTSHETPGFCDTVPTILAGTFDDWEEKQCKKAGMDVAKTGCKSVFTEKLTFCASKTKAAQ